MLFKKNKFCKFTFSTVSNLNKVSTIKNYKFLYGTKEYLRKIYSDKGLKVNVMNQTCPSIEGDHLTSTLDSPYKLFFFIDY